MALIYHELNIPLDTDSTFDYIVIKQGDAGSHKVRATLINNNSVFTIPTSNATYYFKFRKPDNTYVLVQATVSNNQIIADVTEEMLRVAGTGRGEFMIVQGSTELKTATFYFKIVQQTYTTDDVISSSDFATFARLLAGAGNAASNANAAAAAANTAAANAAAKADLIPDDYTALVQKVEDIQDELENLDVETDATLTEQGKPADAKATGDAIAELNGSLKHIEPGLSEEAKVALLRCFAHVMWEDASGSDYYQSLADAIDYHSSNRRSELPSTYEQVEYIKSTGTQWIVLDDILSQVPLRVEAKASFQQNGKVLLSAAIPRTADSRFFMISMVNNRIACRFGNNNYIEAGSGNPPLVNEIYNITSLIEYTAPNSILGRIEFDNGYAQANYTIDPNYVVGNPLKIMISAYDDVKAHVTLYNLVIYSGDTKLFDGIPCYRKVDNISGLYDAVHEKFWSSDGTTDFEIGEIVI